MIFVFPLMISENVDKLAVPGVAKVMEQYYLLHIMTALANGFMRVVMVLDKNNVPKRMLVESSLMNGDLNHMGADGVSVVLEDTDLNSFLKEDEGEAGLPSPGSSVKVDPFDKMTDKVSLVPTLVSAEVDIIYRGGRKIKRVNSSTKSPLSSSGYITPAAVEEEWPPDVDRKRIIIGCKVVPSVVKNFDKIYDVLRDDYYSNLFKFGYKVASRYILRKMYGSGFSRAIKRLASTVFSDDTLSMGWYSDLILSKKSFIDMSPYTTSSRSAAYQQFGAANVCFTYDDEENMFDDPKAVARLLRLGWKGFAILNQLDKEMIFCSHLDRGLCSRIPYQYLFQAINQEQVYKDISELERATASSFRRGNLKPLKRLLK